MAVDQTHPDYDERIDAWELVRDVLEGSRAVKDKREVYLPSLSEMGENEYNAYRSRAIFVNLSKRAHLAWTGMMTRRPPVVEPASALEAPWMDDVDLEGADFVEYVAQLAAHNTSTGRGLTIIDWLEEERRPFVRYVKAEDVINWRCERINGRHRLTMLVIRERSSESVPGFGEASDEFDSTTFEQYRHFQLLPMSGDGATLGVVVNVWRKGSEKKEFAIIDSLTPTRRGIALSEIPVVFNNALTMEASPGEIPLEDIASINVSHYNNSADLENGRHVAGLPTPWAAGFGDGTLTLGVNRAWVSDDVGAKAGFLEFTGSGLTTLEKALEEKQGQIATLGARAIAPEKDDAEAFNTVKMRGAAETASLMNYAGALDKQATAILRWLFWWTATTETSPAELEEYFVVTSKDFISTKLSPDEVRALTEAYLKHAISFSTLFHNLQEGEIYPPDADMEEEEAAIRESGMEAMKMAMDAATAAQGARKPPGQGPDTRNPADAAE